MRRKVLLVNISGVAACALVYELALSTLASFTMGDAVREFSLTLGLYLFAMGVGALLSQRVRDDAIRAYVACELALAIVGAASVPVIMRIEAGSPWQRPALYAAIFVVGALVGVELPLLLRMLRTQRTHGTEPAASSFDLAVSSSLAWDYAGSLFASILFPLVFVPALGLVRTSLLTGAVNAALALSVSWIMRRDTRPRGLALPCGAVCVALAALAVTADALHLVPSE